MPAVEIKGVRKSPKAAPAEQAQAALANVTKADLILAQDTPESANDKSLDKIQIMKLSISSDALISRERMFLNLQEAGLGSLNEIIKPRSETDALRTGVEEILKNRSLSWFSRQEGQEQVACRVVRCPAKVPAGNVREDFHLQERGKTVDYAPLGSVIYESTNPDDPKSSKVCRWEPGPNVHLIPNELRQKLENVPQLMEYGREMLFDKDLRRLSSVLIKQFTRAWAGVWLVKNAQEAEQTRKIQQALESNLIQGKVGVRVYTLENNAETAENLIRDCEDSCVSEYEDLLEMLQNPKVDWKKAAALFYELKNNALAVQRAIGRAFSDRFDQIESEIGAKITNWELNQ